MHFVSTTMSCAPSTYGMYNKGAWTCGNDGMFHIPHCSDGAVTQHMYYRSLLLYQQSVDLRTRTGPCQHSHLSNLRRGMCTTHLTKVTHASRAQYSSIAFCTAPRPAIPDSESDSARKLQICSIDGGGDHLTRNDKSSESIRESDVT